MNQIALRVPAVGILAGAIAMTLSSGAAFAQEGQGRASALEEIVVTAERRVNTEARTAISIEVLTEDFITSNQIKDIIDLQNAVPALQFFQNGSYVQANIRGVGNPSRGGPSEQVGVPVFFDGATQGEEMGINAGFFDVAGIEVLRGPQATFVGQAAAGGAILINSAKPNFDGLSGFVEGTAGAYNQRKILGAVNLPVSDKVAARVAYMSETRDSFYTNVWGQQSPGASEQWTPGDQQDQNFRVSLLWEPTENFSLWTKYENSETHTYGLTAQPNPNSYVGFRDHDGNPATPSIAITTYAPHAPGPAPGTGTLVGNLIYDGIPGPGGAVYDPADPFTLGALPGQERNTKVDRVSVEANWTFGNGITFRSLSSNIEMNRLQNENGDSLVYESLTGWQLGPGMQTWSQEFNLISPDGNRLEWLVGMYKNDRHTELHFNSPQNLPCGWRYDGGWSACPTSFVAGVPRFMWTSLDDVTHQAIFGQLNFQISDALEFTLEARHNEDDNRQIRATLVTNTLVPTATNPVPCLGNVEGQVFYCPPGGQPNIDNPALVPFVWKGDLPTYKVGLNWEPSDGHFLYAFVARGYKAGQSVVAGFPLIHEEVVDDIEIGWKGTLSRTLYAEVGLYHMNYEGMQLGAFQTTAQEGRNAVKNIGDSTIQGIEGSIRAVFGGFGINASLAFNDSELGEIATIDQRALAFLGISGAGATFPGDTSKGCTPATATIGSCLDYTPYEVSFTGSENPLSPKVTYYISFDYAFNLSSGATLTPALSFNHADSTYTNTLQRPDDNYYRTDDRDMVSLSVTYDRDPWNIQFFANNVTDETFIEGHSTTGAAAFFGDPRTVGIRARMQF
jgi:iron complex outermembrane receptor protein